MITQTMNNYTSCFIGIPIPEKYQRGFEDLLGKIPQINSMFKQPYLKTPHITICYLDKQSQNNLQKIAEDVKNYLEILKGVHLKIGGFGYFKEDDPRVLFLDVDYPRVLKEFNELLTKNLSVYSGTANNLPFIPHVTVAWVGDPEAQKVFKLHQPELKALLDEVNWQFEITKVIIYGADSNKKPEYQEKLITLKVI